MDYTASLYVYPYSTLLCYLLIMKNIFFTLQGLSYMARLTFRHYTVQASISQTIMQKKKFMYTELSGKSKY